MRQIDFATVLASSVHDMKNSLCLLIQSIEQLSNRLTSKNVEEAQELAQIHYEASRLNSNLLKVLAIYRQDQDALYMDVDDQFVDDMIEDIIDKNQFYIDQRTLNVEVKIEDDLQWYFDRDLVSNLLNDIVVNAMRYCQKNILITAFQRDNKLVIEIHDDGPGYPDAMLNLNAATPKQINLSMNSTGLGIYFAQLIAHQHEQNNEHGYISLANNGNFNSSVFTLVLP